MTTIAKVIARTLIAGVIACMAAFFAAQRMASVGFLRDDTLPTVAFVVLLVSTVCERGSGASGTSLRRAVAAWMLIAALLMLGIDAVAGNEERAAISRHGDTCEEIVYVARQHPFGNYALLCTPEGWVAND